MNCCSIEKREYIASNVSNTFALFKNSYQIKNSDPLESIFCIKSTRALNKNKCTQEIWIQIWLNKNNIAIIAILVSRYTK